jgi:pimeloyl-ACP methyl ester carboxylesterase
MAKAFIGGAHGMQLEYETTGADDAAPLLLIMGTAAPLTMWDDEFCLELARLGRRVIRFDGRDVGRSTPATAAVPDSIAALMTAFAAGQIAPAYTLEDQADDVIGLLDALAIPSAHLLGISQGGGVAQLAAIRHPRRVSALTLIASSSANPALPGPHPEMMSVLTGPLPGDRAAFIAWNLLLYQRTGSTQPPPDLDWIRARAERTWDHGWSRASFLRQLLAVVTAANRKPYLTAVRVPVEIVHGREDPIIPVAAARDLAEALPHARVTLVPGMGHDLSPPFWGVVSAAVARNR